MSRVANVATLIVLTCLWGSHSATAQIQPTPLGAAPARESAANAELGWRAPAKGGASAAVRSAPAPERDAPTTVRTANAGVKPIIPTAARVTTGDGKLPTGQGQVWREYDIRPYTSNVKSTEKPEQAVIDWILRETGTDIWFTDAPGLLNADKETLRVYHTPEVQRIVANVVDRFVVSQAESYSLGMRMVTLNSPTWRSRAVTLMRPVKVDSPGVEAWLMPKESAALLIGELRKRTDYRELNSPSVDIENGQSQTIAQMKLRSYISGVQMLANYPFYEAQNSQLNEGYSLELSPLYSADGQSLDVVLKCHIDQLEKLVPVTMEIPVPGGAIPGGGVAGSNVQRVQIQVPQVVSWRLHERFRWPADQVLLLSCGVVASPTGEKTSPLGIPGLGSSPGRADALLFIESHGKSNAVLPEPPRPVTTGLLPTISRY